MNVHLIIVRFIWLMDIGIFIRFNGGFYYGKG